MTWFYWAALTATLFATFNLLARKTSADHDDPKMFGIVFNILAAIATLPLFLFNAPASKPLSTTIILLTILSALLYGISVRTQFYAIKHTEASLLTIIYRFTTVITVVTAILFLKEPVTTQKLLGIALVITGNILIVYKNTNLRIDKGFLFAIISAATAGVALTADKFSSAAYSLALYSTMMYILPAFFIAVTPVVPLRKITDAVVHAKWQVWALAILSVVGYYGLLKAFSLADASKVVPVTATSSILTVLASTVILHERSHIVRKIIAAAIVVTGVFLLR